MKRIIFVDDEPRILEGLERLLRPERQDWDMVFVQSGDAALKAMKENSFDVIVSDMRMPGMDGATLLQRVKEHFPGSVRIVLSGYTEMESVLRAVPVAHQFLSKPCEAKVLREAIDRSTKLQSLLHEAPALRAIVGKMQGLPSLPTSYTALLKALSDPKCSIRDISKIIERDVGFCAKILHLVNSAFFGLARRVTDITGAVNLLGTSMIKNMALSMEVFQIFKGCPKLSGFSLEAFQSHAMKTAALARKILPERFKTDDAFIAGMLHDVGKLILATRLPERFTEFLREAQRRQIPVHTVEQEKLGITHAEIGAYLLGSWGLPYPVVEAVAYHHAPRRVVSHSLDVLAAVHISDLLAQEKTPSAAGTCGGAEAIDPAYLQDLGVADRLPQWRAILTEEPAPVETRA